MESNTLTDEPSASGFDPNQPSERVDFDPSKPSILVKAGDSSGFDPSKPSELVSKPASPSLAPELDMPGQSGGAVPSPIRDIRLNPIGNVDVQAAHALQQEGLATSKPPTVIDFDAGPKFDRVTGQEVKQAFPWMSDNVAAHVAGFQQGSAGVYEGLGTPEMMGLATVAWAPKAVQHGLAYLFAGQMGEQVLPGLVKAQDLYKAGKAEEASNVLTQTVASGLMSAGIAGEGLKGETQIEKVVDALPPLARQVKESLAPDQARLFVAPQSAPPEGMRTFPADWEAMKAKPSEPSVNDPIPADLPPPSYFYPESPTPPPMEKEAFPEPSAGEIKAPKELLDMLPPPKPPKPIFPENAVQSGLKEGATPPMDEQVFSAMKQIDEKLGSEERQGMIDSANRRDAFLAARAEAVSRLWNGEHPDFGRALPDNALAIVEESLTKALHNPFKDAAERERGLISGSALEDWADGKIKQSREGMNMIGPDTLAAYVVKAAAHLERGITDLGEWSATMIKEFGPKIRPLLPQIRRMAEDARASVMKSATAPIAQPLPEPATRATEVEKVSTTAAANAIQDLSEKKNTPEPGLRMARVNPENGASAAPPSTSVFVPDTPPGRDPWPIYAKRAIAGFKEWWDDKWPRSLAVTKLTPDSPVITEHQRWIKAQQDYMENFSSQPWWKAVNARDNFTNIELENHLVNEYRRNLADGMDHQAAYERALATMPEDFKALIRHRDSRLAIEREATDILNVDPPNKTNDPYIARLTNEEGKNVVDLNPKDTNLGKRIRSTIGSFDNSRTFTTMKDGISKGVQYDPVNKAVWLREMVSAKLEATADMLSRLKGEVLFDTKEEALAASPNGNATLVRGFGGKDYWARTRDEAVFLEQNLNSTKGGPFAKMNQLLNTYARNPNLVNPLPHVTKNMAFKYALARVGNATFKADVADFLKASEPELLKRFRDVMPISETGDRLPGLTAKEVGSWAEKMTVKGLKINDPSSKFIFAKADPAMRYSLWKSYIRKGMGDQEAANHVWLDLVRYDENSGGINFWKQIPLNFFVPWRTGTYVTLAKAMMAHPIRTLLFVGAIDYLREMRYRATGRWTHLPSDYLEAPIAEAIKDPKLAPGVVATTLLFGPGGGQAPSSIKDVMEAISDDPGQKARIQNMFWGVSQIFNLSRDFEAYRKDGKVSHLVDMMTTAAIAEHSAIKYEPRRLAQWLPDWLPGMEKAAILKEAEELRAKINVKREKSQTTYENRHGVSRTFERTTEQQQIEDLRRASGRKVP